MNADRHGDHHRERLRSAIALRRVLFVAYQFPPVGGVGVQRVTKFVKYLPMFGWQSSVLTVSNPSVPLHDESFSRDIPPGTIIRRAATMEPGYAVKQAVSASSAAPRNSLKSAIRSLARQFSNFILQPDAQVLWHPAAYREGKRLLADARHDVIVATGPPFSSFLLGAKLSVATGVPLILDYRDEWGISNAYWENKQQGGVSNWIQRRQQARAMRAASLLVATTPSSAASVGATASEFGIDVKTACVYNGFDPDDFLFSGRHNREKARPAHKKDYGAGTHRFRLAFVGTLWNLNSIEPLVQAVLRLHQQRCPLLAELELLFVGRRTADQDTLLDQLNDTECRVTRLPFIEHAEAVKLMQSADSLLMLNSDLPHAERIINAKAFEYIGARRPMFVIAPRGDVWDVVDGLPGTVLCEPSHIESIADRLATVIEQFRLGFTYQDAHWDTRQFERKQVAERLAELLDRVTEQANNERWDQQSQPSLECR